MTWVVYGIHPVGRPNEPFYIGRTGNFYQRRSAHWKSQGSKVYERIQCLRANGIESEMTIISSHESPARAHQAEYTLLRSTDGLVNRPISLGAIPIAISVIPSMERQIEEFRLKNGLPSRTAAIRELIERGLK